MIDALREGLDGLSSQEWMNWRAKYEHFVSDYVAATPSQRLRRKSWQDPMLRRLLTLTGHQYCLEAHALLDTIAAGAFSTGPSYRHMAAHTGPFYWRMLSHRIPRWPFDSPSPFVS